jgi:hypothetical protein
MRVACYLLPANCFQTPPAASCLNLSKGPKSLNSHGPCYDPSFQIAAEGLLQGAARVQERQERKAARQPGKRQRRSSNGSGNRKESLHLPPPLAPRLPASGTWQHSSGSGLGSGNGGRGAGLLGAAEGWQVGQAGMAAVAGGNHLGNSISSLASQLKPIQPHELQAALLRAIPRQDPACMPGCIYAVVVHGCVCGCLPGKGCPAGTACHTCQFTHSLILERCAAVPACLPDTSQ